jgi:alkanesulfonate monooxygenase SsuD/methylene tetrahydromethanopterin reductase-like flavin-dependent oxidoreductase (luciferase family)
VSTSTPSPSPPAPPAPGATHRGAVQRGLSFGLSGLSAHAAAPTPAAYHRALRDVVEHAVLAEEHGFDAVWTCEHHFSADGYLPAPLVALAAIAERTERVTVGTDILLASMWDPVRLAEEAAVVDQLSGGRLLLGFGTGYRDVEFEGLGLQRRQRVPRLLECVRVLRQAATEGVLTGVGLLDDDVTVPTSPLPWQGGGPPVWFGGFVEPAVRRAGRHADGYIAPQMGAGGLRRRIGWIREETGREDFAVAQSTLTFVAARDAAETVAPGLRQLQSQARGWRGTATGSRGAGAEAPAGSGEGPAGGAPAPAEWQPGQEWESADPGRAMAHDDERLSHALVIGTPEECVEKLRPFVEVLGALPPTAVGHLASRLAYPGVSDEANAESIRLYATEVIPALRELVPTR